MIYYLLLSKSGYSGALNIVTNDEFLKNDLLIYYCPFAKLLIDRESNEYPTFEYYIYGKTSYSYYEGQKIDKEDPLFAISKILSRNLYALESSIILHAALLEWNGEGVILIAPSGTGKTTLSRYLIEHGFKYISDDYVMITEDGKCTQNIITPMRLRLGGLDVLKQEDICFDESLQRTYYGGKARYLYIPKDSQISKYKRTPIKSIIYIYRHSFLCESCKMSKAELFHCLLTNSAVSENSNSLFIKKYIKLLDVDGVIIKYNDFGGFLRELNKYL